MRKKVLIPDDVSIFLELENSFFEKDDIEILVIEEGDDVLETIRRERPSLVLLDMNMPGFEGGDACLRAKADVELRGIPVVLMSHANWEEDLRQAQGTGCDDIILKPINRDHFLKTIRELLHIADRAAPRVPVRMAVRFGPLTDELIASHTIDMSIGGVFVKSGDTFPTETPVSIVLTLPDTGEFHCRGRIAWKNDAEDPVKPILPPGVGLQFIDLDAEQKRAVEDLVERLLRKPGL